MFESNMDKFHFSACLKKALNKLSHEIVITFLKKIQKKFFETKFGGML
jgi:hypothetical protein